MTEPKLIEEPTPSTRELIGVLQMDVPMSDAQRKALRGLWGKRMRQAIKDEDDKRDELIVNGDPDAPNEYRVMRLPECLRETT